MISLPDSAWNEALLSRAVAERGLRKSKHLSDRIEDIECRVFHQSILIQSLIRILVDRLSVPEADLNSLVQELEMKSTSLEEDTPFALK